MKLINYILVLVIIPVMYSCAKQEEDKLVTSESNNTAPSSHVKTYAVSAGSSQCPYGGVQREMGIDDNMTGTLDASEVDKTDYVCTGSPGASEIMQLLSIH